MTVSIALILISILGIVLVLILGFQLYNLDQHKKLKKFRSKDESLADLLLCDVLIDDGIILNKNGSLMVAWEYRSIDNSSATNDERELLSYRINQLGIKLGNGWVFHIDSITSPSNNYPAPGLSNFPDPVTYAMDEERRRLFNEIGTLYENRFVLTATFLPPTITEQKFIEMMFDDDNKKSNHMDNILAQFKRDVRTIESSLDSAFTIKRLKSNQVISENNDKVTYDDFLSHIHFCITGIHQPIRIPKNPINLDLLIGNQEMWGGVIPKIGNKYIQIVSIDGFPDATYPGILTALSYMQVEYRWSTRYIYLDPHEALEQYEKFRKRWKQKERGIIAQIFNPATSNVDEDAMHMTMDAVSAKAEINEGSVAQGYYTSLVILMHEKRDVVEHAAIETKKLIERTIGFTARVETINTMDAFFGSIPGHTAENVRRPFINTLNLADMMPVSSVWTGHATHPCPFYPSGSPAVLKAITAGHAPLNLNLHVGDVGHTFIVGPTGSGKSVLLATLAAQYRRYNGMRIFAFDKGKSMMPLTLAVGGSFFSIAADDSSTGFAPLQFLDTKNDRAWAMEYIENILLLNEVELSPGIRNDIAEAIIDLAEAGKHTISDFYLSVQNETVRQAIKQYMVGETMGHLIDAKSDNLKLSDFSCFELEDLMNLSPKYALPVLLYLFRRIERDLQSGENQGKPAVIFLDEAWLMFEHPAFKGKIREWLKVLRRANCHVIMATQNLADAEKSNMLDVLISETATKIFLPNPAANSAANSAFYQLFGLNERQINIISSAVQKREYYFYSSEGCRLFNLAIQPLMLAFVGANDRESLKKIEALYQQFGNDWIHPYLAAKNLNLSDYIPESMNFDSIKESA